MLEDKTVWGTNDNSRTAYMDTQVSRGAAQAGGQAPSQAGGQDRTGPGAALGGDASLASQPCLPILNSAGAAAAALNMQPGFFRHTSACACWQLRQGRDICMQQSWHVLAAAASISSRPCDARGGRQQGRALGRQSTELSMRDACVLGGWVGWVVGSCELQMPLV